MLSHCLFLLPDEKFSIVVIDQGKIVLAKGYGVKDANTKELVDTNTLFQACSISKMVTTVGLLLLVQEGKIDLDTDVNTYLKRWKVPKRPPFEKDPLTIRQLLSHTGGVTVSGVTGYPNEEKFSDIFEFLNGTKPISKNNEKYIP